MLIRLWVAGNLLGWTGTIIQLGTVGPGTLPVGLQGFYITAGAIFPVLAIAGFVEMTQSAYFARSGNIARILGFSIPIVGGEAVCLTALAQETSHEWMITSTVTALVITFGFQVSLLAIRALFAYTHSTDLSERVIPTRLKRATREWEETKGHFEDATRVERVRLAWWSVLVLVLAAVTVVVVTVVVVTVVVVGVVVVGVV